MTPFSIPTPGTILSALSVNPYPVPMSGLDVGAVQQYDEAAAQVDAFHMTQVAKNNYLNITFANWLASYGSGRLPVDAQPPQPPKAFVVKVAPPPEDGSFIDQYDTVQEGDPVCPVPRYTKEPAPQAPPVPPPSVEIGEVMQAEPPQTDGFPLGYRQTNPDGSVYVKRARVLPFGTAYFWLRTR